MLLFAALATAPAEPETAAAQDLAGLVQRVAEAGEQALSFEETRPSSLLAEPLTITGTLHRDGDRLVRETSTPRSETQILAADYFEVRRAGGFRQRFSLSRAPELGALRQALLALLDGDADQLGQDFAHELSWDDDQWHLVLVPHDTAMAERVQRLELSGRDNRLETMNLHLVDDELIQTRFTTQP
ncbi:MAG: hypothetical protein EA370_15710 [Wenzhouxiangella sp.]|nr:MAG: hypothetical protein EA370_15710 [Wenzhouxiangella sp.]